MELETVRQELEAVRFKYYQVQDVIADIAAVHLKNFRPAKKADSKELYEGRLLAFIEALLDQLYPDEE